MVYPTFFRIVVCSWLLLGHCWLATAMSMAPMGRVVLFEVLYEGEVVLLGHTSDDGEGFDTAWGYLKTLPLRSPTSTFAMNEAETKRLAEFHESFDRFVDGNTAILKGQVRIFCRYAGNIEVESLRLVRDNAEAPWTIEPEQVEAMAKKRTIDRRMRTRAKWDADMAQEKEKARSESKLPKN